MLRSIAPRTLPYLSLTDKYNKVEFDAAEHSSADATEFCFSKLNKVKFNVDIKQGEIRYA